MDQEVTRIIVEALEAIDYRKNENNNSLRSAIQDLANKYQDEKKFFIRNADDRFLGICRTAMTGRTEQMENIISQAAGYVKDEYWIDEKFAREITNATVSAFYFYGKETAPDAKAMDAEATEMLFSGSTEMIGHEEDEPTERVVDTGLDGPQSTALAGRQAPAVRRQGASRPAVSMSSRGVSGMSISEDGFSGIDMPEVEKPQKNNNVVKYSLIVAALVIVMIAAGYISGTYF